MRSPFARRRAGCGLQSAGGVTGRAAFVRTSFGALARIVRGTASGASEGEWTSAHLLPLAYPMTMACFSSTRSSLRYVPFLKQELIEVSRNVKNTWATKRP